MHPRVATHTQPRGMPSMRVLSGQWKACALRPDARNGSRIWSTRFATRDAPISAFTIPEICSTSHMCNVGWKSARLCRTSSSGFPRVRGSNHQDRCPCLIPCSASCACSRNYPMSPYVPVPWISAITPPWWPDSMRAVLRLCRMCSVRVNAQRTRRAASVVNAGHAGNQKTRQFPIANIKENSMINAKTIHQCDGCNSPLGPLDIEYSVCMPCTCARHRAVLKRRCCCGRLRRPRRVSTGSRTWIACDRCLGTVKQIR
jgi:hypothetical protein